MATIAYLIIVWLTEWKFSWWIFLLLAALETRIFKSEDKEDVEEDNFTGVEEIEDDDDYNHL